MLRFIVVLGASAHLFASAYQLPATASAPAVRARSGIAKAALLADATPPKTVGDAKIAFQAAYGRPVGGVQQGFVAEMLTSVTLAMLAPTYQENRVFSLGFENLCTTFLGGAVSEEQQAKLHDSLCAGVGFDKDAVAAEAAALEAFATGKTEDELLASDDLAAIAAAGNFKYSYPLGAGILTLMPLVGVEPSDEAIERWCTQLKLPTARLQKDYAFYVDAQRKLVEVKQMMMEMQAAGKRKEAQKLKEEAAKAAAEAEAAATEAEAAA